MADHSKTVFVTGGGGFLGKRICTLLKAQGFDVVSFSRKTYPALEALGIRSVAGNICSREDLQRAMPDHCYGVIHTAGQVGIWGRWQDFYETNAVGTAQVLAAMRA